MKKELKQLNHTEFRNIGEKIELYRQNLQYIQTQRGHHTQPDLLFEEEEEVKIELEKWSLVEESILKQKSRNKWLELGYENNAYFFASLRNRQAQNRITSLIDSKGDIIQQPEDIAAEVTSFYKTLLGSAAAQLPVIDLKVMKRGNVLNRHQQLQLVSQVTQDEVFHALMSIDDHKAPGYDGFK
ncbi:PREDICTED: uncharacterized protein LOC109243445 [Nicotiana attenuata]|uniref:uncharacterized protein LOC109243445 n=1 Tax=Nicotiana attenuata TaxID=49451 RepID=UPI00090553B4|nr:PREDICTED: uncharacterized protein LOC109243445 [Nicotiana attenuata]